MMLGKSIRELHELIVAGELSIPDLVNESLARAQEVSGKHALISTLDDYATRRAQELQENLDKAKDKPLFGIPVVIKDNILINTGKTTAASKMLENFQSPYNATVVERLESAGAVIVAKANLDAFAHGSSTENSDFGLTKNPHDDSRVPGGSSGGSAASVALDIAPVAIGTDTGGSIRLPASYCGVVGYKPSYGLVSRYGVVAMASSLDVVGPMTRTVEDTAIVMDVISGVDERDSTTTVRDTAPYSDFSKIDWAKLKVGVVSEYLESGLSEEVRESVENSIDILKSAGANVENVSLPMLKYALASYYIIMPAEVSSNLSRYDGIRYGLHGREGDGLDEMYLDSRSTGFNAEVTRRILLGTFVLSSGYYDAYYKKAQQVRTLIRADFEKALEKYDVLIGPVAPDVAFKIGENTSDPLKMYLTDIMTVAANIAGIPAVSLPSGVGQKTKMPIGLQLIGAQAKDRMLLNVVYNLEKLLENKK